MFGQTDKYFDASFEKYLFVNSGNHDVPDGWRVIEYDDSLPYQSRIVSCLKQLPKDKIVVFHHEDMFLYNEPDFEALDRVYTKISSEKINFIKLGKASYTPEKPLYHLEDEIYHCPFDLLFAIQPTMCKVRDIQIIYEQTPGNNIWEFEVNSNITCMKNGFVCCLTSKDEEEKIGMFHWESLTYPYFATAIVKGKWNTEDYAKQLELIFDEYSIDPTMRGVNA
jgi:hypothetical protein